MLHIAWICTAIACNYVHAKLQMRGLRGATAHAVWEATHRVNARLLFDAIVSLSGFWVKLGQTMSVDPMLPDAFGVELSKLQDSMPPIPRVEIERTMSEEFGPLWRASFELGEVVGVATVAQVHRATVSDGGVRKPAVVKVQNPMISTMLRVDISCASNLAKFFEWFNPKLFTGFPLMVRDLASMTLAELDFRDEVANLRDAREACEEPCSRAISPQLGLPVGLPQVFDGWTSRRAFAMEFVNGAKLTEYVKQVGLHSSSDTIS